MGLLVADATKIVDWMDALTNFVVTIDGSYTIEKIRSFVSTATAIKITYLVSFYETREKYDAITMSVHNYLPFYEKQMTITVDSLPPGDLFDYIYANLISTYNWTSTQNI